MNGLGTRSYNRSPEARRNKHVSVPKSALDRANEKVAKAVRERKPSESKTHVTLTRAEWTELWMATPANRHEFEAPLSCTCAQRPYPHEVSVHRLTRYESRLRDGSPVMKWPWTLRFLGDMADPVIENSKEKT